MGFTSREEKGRPLSYKEVDDNIIYVGEQAQAAATAAAAALAAANTAAVAAVAAVQTEINDELTAAQNAAILAGAFANAGEDVEVAPGVFSARHWAEKAAETVATGVIDDASSADNKAFSASRMLKGGWRSVPVAASLAIVAGDEARIEQTGAAVTLELPAAPVSGEEFLINNMNTRTDNIVNTNGKPIRGAALVPASTLVINKAHVAFVLKFIDNTYGYQIV